MNATDFQDFMHRNLENFVANMENIDIKEAQKQEWMRLFLNWMEWQTMAHNMYWAPYGESHEGEG